MSGKQRQLILGLAFNKLADLLSSAKTTLPALLIAIGAPAWMIGWLVPIRESGALLPQALIGVYLRKHSARHHVWRTGMAVQISAVSTMLASALLFEGIVAGGIVIGALIFLSIGRSACSLTVKDMEADVAEKGTRGRLVGIASTASGVMTLLFAAPMVYFQDALQDYALYALLGAAVFAFIITFACMLSLKTYVEVDGDSDKKGGGWQFDSVVYKFIFVRGLFVHSALVAPYFMLESGEDATTLLPFYIAAQALATLLSSFVWGKVADKSATLTLRLAGTMALLACLGLLVIGAETLWVSALLFFVLSVAHAGVRTGRKTYSLDVKDGQQRTELVGFSNTAIGLILLAFGALYAGLSSFITFSVVYIMASVLVVAIAATWCLPKEK